MRAHCQVYGGMHNSQDMLRYDGFTYNCAGFTNICVARWVPCRDCGVQLDEPFAMAARQVARGTMF